jgi:cytochrome o ubiquinol oxidase subunit 1
MFGKLSLKALPLDDPVTFGAFLFLVAVVVAVLVLITVKRKWKWLWTDWLTTVDHKKIGIMYIVGASAMGLRAFVDGVMMRSQQAVAFGPGQGPFSPELYNQVFSAHGTIMILFMAMPFLIGLINIAVPLQIGARDVAFPFMNAVSFWLFVAGALLANISLGIGEFAKTGWSGYAPLSELGYSPGVGVDYYIWSIEIAGVGTLLTGVNFLVTILRMRAPGMGMMKMPIFTWTSFCTAILIIGAFPVLTVVLGLLALDRYLGMHFFTNALGGNPMMYVNLFWAWGHPEVYILILPAFGVFAEASATFSGNRLYGYNSVVGATVAITVLSYSVWVHHFFTMGAGGDVNAVFGIATMLIAIPTGVKIFNWLFTIFRGRLRLDTPILWTLGFMITFTIGGMTGIMLSMPPADFVLHASMFLIAHFHNVIVGGTVFGAVAGFIYWFPKAFGFKLNERLGKIAFWLFLSGFILTFVPMYILGFMGMTRRLNYTTNPAWRPLLWLAAGGVAVFALSLLAFALQIIVSIRQRKQNLDKSGDPWNGRTLEWSVPSPPPSYNFAVIPTVTERDSFWEMKRKGGKRRPPVYRDIIEPRNTPAGFVIGAFAAVFGFAIIWHIWWLVVVGLLGMLVTLVVRTSNDHIYRVVSAEEVRRGDAAAAARGRTAPAEGGLKP